MRITLIGHVCVDLNVVRGTQEEFYGGGVIHGAVTALRLGALPTVITKCAAEHRAGFRSLDEPGIVTRFLPSRFSTSILNVYPSENPDERQSTLVSRADPFSAGDIETVEADVAHVNPLWFGEFPVDLLPLLKRRAKLLAGDAQGFLRRAGEDGKMSYVDLAGKREVLSLFDVFKVDAKEARILTGADDMRQAVRLVRDLGPEIVILTHRDGVCVFDGLKCYESPFSGFTLEGRTGRGDTCTAAFLVGMRELGLSEATKLAAEVTSRKMQYRGPYRG